MVAPDSKIWMLISVLNVSLSLSLLVRHLKLFEIRGFLSVKQCGGSIQPTPNLVILFEHHQIVNSIISTWFPSLVLLSSFLSKYSVRNSTFRSLNQQFFLSHRFTLWFTSEFSCVICGDYSVEVNSLWISEFYFPSSFISQTSEVHWISRITSGITSRITSRITS